VNLRVDDFDRIDIGHCCLIPFQVPELALIESTAACSPGLATI
jgi:hypothetical protein